MPLSGADCAFAAPGMTPGRASAAASSGLIFRFGCGSSVAATAASADAVAAGRSFLAEVDVLLRLDVEAVVVELHVGLGEVALLPCLGRLEGGATAEQNGDEDE